MCWCVGRLIVFFFLFCVVCKVNAAINKILHGVKKKNFAFIIFVTDEFPQLLFVPKTIELEISLFYHYEAAIKDSLLLKTFE